MTKRKNSYGYGYGKKYGYGKGYGYGYGKNDGADYSPAKKSMRKTDPRNE